MTEPVGPLAYHHAVADLLERENPNAFATLLPALAGDSVGLDQELLRSTYRLEASAHPNVHAAVARAAQALGIDVPVEIYADEGGRPTNAELIFVPSRAVLLFSGDTLNVLDNAELCAVAGHELAHHALWTREGGRHLAASRLLDAAESDARTPSEYLETARRLRLATELYADRGALSACGDLGTTISALLKITTGLRAVDAAAYLRQAAEVDFTKASAGSTHPETVLRAWALQQWSEGGAGADDTVDAALAPQLDLASVDVLAQDRMLRLTRELVMAVLSTEGLDGANHVELAEQYGVAPSATPAAAPLLADLPLSKDTRNYFAAVLVDFATVDDDAGTQSHALVLALAQRVGLGPDTERLLVTELGLSDRVRAKLTERVAALTDPPVQSSTSAPSVSLSKPEVGG